MAKAMFLMWYDDSPKVTVLAKIAEAIDAYQDRFKITPNVVLVNEDDVIDHQEITVRGVSHIRRNNFWVGLEDIVQV